MSDQVCDQTNFAAQDIFAKAALPLQGSVQGLQIGHGVDLGLVEQQVHLQPKRFLADIAT